MAKPKARVGDKMNDQPPIPIRPGINPLAQISRKTQDPMERIERLERELGEAIETFRSMERQHETVLKVLAAQEKMLKEIAAAVGVPSKRLSIRRSISPAREPLKDKDIQVPGGVYLTEKVLPGNKRVEIQVTVVGSSVDDGTVVYETYSKEKTPRRFRRPASQLFESPKDWTPPDEDTGDEGE